MQGRVRTEDIYDAVLDDEGFSRLPALLIESIGARSGVLHWRTADNDLGEISDTGYFSAEQMREYDRHFAADDLWSEAMQLPSVANRAWNCAHLIPQKIYEKSRIYNEWIRPMGDDTFYAVGAAVRADWGVGEIGFHRGKGQGPFGEEAIRTLSENLGHLHRMLNIRAQLAKGSKIASSALNMLGQGIISLTEGGRILHLNASAEAMIGRGDGLCIVNGLLSARSIADQTALKAAIAKAAQPSGTEGSGLLVHRSGGQSYVLSIVSVNTGFTGRQILVLVTDPAARDESLPCRLRALFNLTASEAHLAMRLSEGANPGEVAQERGTSLGTIRSQLKSVSAKLGCSRQAEIVALVKNLPRLHMSH